MESEMRSIFAIKEHKNPRDLYFIFMMFHRAESF